MPQVWGGIDVGALSAGIVATGAFAATVLRGIRKGLKDIRAEAEDSPGKIVGGTIMSSVEIAMLSERLRENTEAVRGAADSMCDELRETRHQIERLRDKMS